MVDTRLDRRGGQWGLLAVAVTLALVFLGSSGLTWFDAALIGYLFGTLFAIFGLIVSKLLVQDFILKRSKIRWAGHQLLPRRGGSARRG